MSTNDPADVTTTSEQPARTGERDLGQFVVVGVLVVLGLYMIVSTWDVVAGFEGGDPLGPRFFALFVGIGLLVLAALYTVSILRGERGEEEAGEDVDLEGGAHWPTVVQLVALVALNVLLIDFLGWAITGALLFAGGAWIIGSRTPVRDLAIGAVLSVGSWYAFYVGLGVPLPPGVLDGIL